MDSNTCNKHEAKHKTVLFIKLKITLAINEFTPDDLMKTGYFGCVFIQELTEIMCPKTFISQPESIIKYFQLRIIGLVLFHKTSITVLRSNQFKTLFFKSSDQISILRKNI